MLLRQVCTAPSYGSYIQSSLHLCLQGKRMKTCKSHTFMDSGSSFWQERQVLQAILKVYQVNQITIGFN